MKGEPVSLSCDVFSYGMILYEIFAGKLPFHDVKTHSVVSSKIMSGEVRMAILSAIINEPSLAVYRIERISQSIGSS